MTPYSAFARYYDALTADVDYAARAAYFDGIIRGVVPDAALLLDLACGTGSLSYEMAALGYDVTGVDMSGEMLAAALSKGREDGPRVLFLQQRMERLDLYGTVDAAVCALDSLNHLTRPQLVRTLGRLRLFVRPGGVFVFDLNTAYKHRHVLADNCFVREAGDVLCIWRNQPLLEEDAVEIALDFFERRQDGLYRRAQEVFRERVFPDALVRGLLDEAGFDVLAVYEADSLSAPGEQSERVVYAARRREE